MSPQIPPERRRDLSLKEVCYQLSVSRHWIVRRLGTDEVPPHIRRGGFILFPRKAFDEWQRRNEMQMGGA